MIGSNTLLTPTDLAAEGDGALFDMEMGSETARLWESLNQMISSIAHGVKTPLGILLMGTDFLDKKIAPNDPSAARVLEDMRNAIGRANGIVRALLDLSCADTPAPQAEDIHALADAALQKVARELAAKRINVVRDYASGEYPLDLDGIQIQQALAHLLANAVVATPPGGFVKVQTRALPAGLRLVIQDSGSGIPEAILNRVCEPFFTTDKSGRKAGLGLTVARRIVESHGGRLSVTNSEAGGAIVSIVLRANPQPMSN